MKQKREPSRWSRIPTTSKHRDRDIDIEIEIEIQTETEIESGAGDGDGGGPGGSSLSYSSHYGKRGGKPYEPQTVVGGQNKLAEIAEALGVVYKNGTYWWWSDFVWGTGGAGSRYGVGMDRYARDGFYGGYGCVMVIIDSNLDFIVFVLTL